MGRAARCLASRAKEEPGSRLGRFSGMETAEPTPEALAASPETGSEASVARTLHARRRSPAVAFLIGAAVIGAIGVAAYLFWPDAAQTPVTPAEAVITDELPDMPVPDGDAIRAQVDAALAQTPSDPDAPAEQAAASAQAQTGPEADDSPAAARPASPDQAEAAIQRDATLNVQARQ